jgi:hypothetical protein
MARTIFGTFDGEVVRFEEPVELAPNTRVRVTIDEPVDAADRPYSFLQAALEMDLQGPPDWSERIDDYLYGDRGEAKSFLDVVQGMKLDGLLAPITRH